MIITFNNCNFKATIVKSETVVKFCNKNTILRQYLSMGKIIFNQYWVNDDLVKEIHVNIF